jgi:hypothetical protein
VVKGDKMKIKNWNTFQHFKDRRPPWIKLHRDIMEQRDINMITDRSFRVLVNLWILASEDKTLQGVLPPIPDIAFRLRLEESVIVSSLQELGQWIDSDDIDLISDCNQPVPPEVETETEKETKVKNKTVVRFTPPSLEEVNSYCQERGKGVDAERWMNHYEANGWMVGKNKMKVWKAAVRTWETGTIPAKAKPQRKVMLGFD